MKKILIVITALLFFVAACSTGTTQLEETMTEPEVVPEEEQAPTQEEENNDERVADHVFSLTGDNFNFYDAQGNVGSTLVVQEGDLVRIEFESVGGMHDWVVDEFDARTDIVRDGEGLTVVEFVADQAGEFEYYCSVGSHRANGMVGLLVVE